MANLALTTKDDVKKALGIPFTETSKDAQIELAIAGAEAAIRVATGRSFEERDDPEVATAREYGYEESGVVAVDDFKHDSLDGIVVAGNAMSAGTWAEHPLSTEYPVAWWVEVYPPRRPSPEMGFTRNEDVLAEEGRLPPYGTTLTVTAVWGWTEVPKDVAQAAIWTAIAFQDQPRAVISESIAGMSRTYANPLVDAIPPRAQALLDAHTKAV